MPVVAAPSRPRRLRQFYGRFSLGLMLRSSLAGLFILAVCSRMPAQRRTVAITVDDLPYVTEDAKKAPSDESRMAQEMNRKLLEAFSRHRVPVTGFVIEQGVRELGASGAEVLKQWVLQGFDLGNHTESHPDINVLSVPRVEEEIVGGERTFVPLMRAAGRNVEFFRFPMNHTGDTKAKHDAIAAFLSAHGYKVAACTIDNSDYLFNAAYLRILAKNDGEAATRLRREYLNYTSLEIDYYASLNKLVLGYEPPQVMVLHDNRLNGDTIGSVLRLFERKGYAFVSLGTAQSDAAYSIPDTYITEYGPMWGYRWAKEKNVHLNGRLEPDPPGWVLALAKGE